MSTARTNYDNFHARSIGPATREAFWAEQAKRIDWQTPPGEGPGKSGQPICDVSNPPFVKWFAGATTNLCHNAIDRHLATRANQPALHWVSTELLDANNQPKSVSYTYAELHAEVNRMAAIFQSLGVGKGDRVLIYMPMVPQAVFAMLAAVRIGAIHSVVFGGFASVSLASRIDDATPKLVVSADAGSRGGKVIPYKPLLDEALRLATHKPAHVLMVDRGLAPFEAVAGRDLAYEALREQHAGASVPVTWVDATHPSYTLYTSGTTGKPKGVQRDTGGYAVALAASMEHIFPGEPGETYFCASDIGWVVGHCYIVYAPLMHGMATILYEGLPIHPDGAIWWSLIERFKVTVMFAAPTAVRVLKKQDPTLLKRHDLSSLKALYLAGEPLDEPTAKWIADGIGKPIIDNYWQTESGWPILTVPRGEAVGVHGSPNLPTTFGSPGLPMAGYDVKIFDDQTGGVITEPHKKGVVGIEGPLPPGCMQTVWGDDARFVNTYWKTIPGKLTYSTFDWGIRDEQGYFFILGRTDDVINVAGHRLGTREIEESISSHPAIAEVAVVGVADQLKGQVAVAFAVVRNPATVKDVKDRLKLEGEVMKTVDSQLGAVARPARVHFVTLLPKTRSGKLLRRALQAVCEGRDPGDLTTIEDPAALEQVKALLTPAG